MLEVSVPLKLILFGEHFGVLGFPIAGIPLVSQRFNLELQVLGRGDALDQKIPEKYHATLLSDLALVKKEFGIKKNFKVSFSTDIAPGMGAGVSAAWSVALTKIIMNFCTFKMSHHRDLDLIEQLEKKHHGQMSGLDHGVIFHQQGVLMKEKQISQFFDVSGSALVEHLFVLIGAAPLESTKEMVQNFQTDFSLEQMSVADRDFLEDSDEIFLDILETEDTARWVKFINWFGRQLEDVDMISEESRVDFELFRSLGGAVKVCGAGGRTSGFGLGMCWHEDEKFVRDFWAERGVEVKRL